ncbi:MAG: hypothetical protein ABIR11_01050, partial [Candidatus Limnocylindrales bacterium]
MKNRSDTLATTVLLTGLLLACARLLACIPADPKAEAAASYAAQQLACVDTYADKHNIDACRIDCPRERQVVCELTLLALPLKAAPMPDDKPPMPVQPKTVNLPAMTNRALLEDLGRVVRTIADNMNEQRIDIHKLIATAASTDERLGRIEGRVAILEAAPVTFVPSTPPPPPLTSTKVRALIDG